MADINQLIDALAGALRDHDAGLGSMPREEIADALALADAADEEHRAQVRALRADVEAAKGQAHNDAEARGWERGYDYNARERDKMRRERDDAQADAAKVRRGARCLRERCRRLEARAKMAEEAAHEAMTRGGGWLDFVNDDAGLLPARRQYVERD